MSARLRTLAACDASAARQFAPWANLPQFSCGKCGSVFATKADKLRHKRTCGKMEQSPAPPHVQPEDRFVDMRQHRSARIRALANAEWAAMDDRGRLPDDWEQQRAEIEARFKENGRG